MIRAETKVVLLLATVVQLLATVVQLDSTTNGGSLRSSVRHICPRGLAGPACAQLAWPSCVVEGVQIDCRSPAPCPCFSECDNDFMLDSSLLACYNTSGRPSTFTEMLSAPLVAYNRGGSAAGSKVSAGPTERWSHPSECAALDKCNGHGLCDGDKKCSRCFAVYSTPENVYVQGDVYEGSKCERVNGWSKPCVSPDCSGRGVCHNGVCICKLGFHGVACEFPFKDRHRAPSRPAIYIYTLPPAFNVYLDAWSNERNTGWWLWRALLNSTHRTFNPHEADFFFVPVFPMFSVQEAVLVRALHYIQQALPYWNATRGNNHIAVGAWDFGLAKIAGLPDFQRIIQLSHFGWTNATRPWQVTVDGRCRFKTGAACATLVGHLGSAHGVHRPALDIVIPDIMEQRFKLEKSVAVTAKRTTRVFFAGSPTNIFREDVYALHRNISGWRIVNGHVDLAKEVATAVFCLDLSGAGFSTRFTLAMVLGCIPVYIDELVQPWDSVLPLEQFSIRFTVAELPQLPRIIASFSDERVAQLQAAVLKYRSAYHWRTLFGPAGDATSSGPDAFETLMMALAKRT